LNEDYWGLPALFRVITTAASTSTASFEGQECSVTYAQGLAQGRYQFHIGSTSPPMCQGPENCRCAQKEQQLGHVTYKICPCDICLLVTSTHLHQASELWDLATMTPPSRTVTPKSSFLCISLQLKIIRLAVLWSSHPQAHLFVRPSPICRPVEF
jgi:hypothetical protein